MLELIKQWVPSIIVGVVLLVINLTKTKIVKGRIDLKELTNQIVTLVQLVTESKLVCKKEKEENEENELAKLISEIKKEMDKNGIREIHKN